jgi:hypothetical protein
VLVFGAVAAGRGLRFNNPYRLATPLGDTARSVSLSATYVDVAVGALMDGSFGGKHGAALSLQAALDGIDQFGVTPSYVLELGVLSWAALRGRVGVPVVILPDTLPGLEAGVASVFNVGLGLGVSAELIGSLFFGAATEDSSVTTIPMLSLQLGLVFGHEVGW